MKQVQQWLDSFYAPTSFVGVYNYATDDYEYIPSGAPISDEQARRYIPQDKWSQELYAECRAHDENTLEAMGRVLLEHLKRPATTLNQE